MDEQEKYIEALIRLHSGLKRQGPGDPVFTDFIMDQLPELPDSPRIADIGCGAGAGAIALAKRYGSKVKAVDFSKPFLEQMMERAQQEGVSDLIEPIECDMGTLNWQEASIDLLWSEGAAYNIGFENALRRWRPLIAQRGVAVVSEMNYFSDNVPEALVGYMETAYPDIKTEAVNESLVKASGYRLIGVHRLPSKAWWDNYYDPLQEKMTQLNNTDDEVLKAVITETEEEMALFKVYAEYYGYACFVMQAV